MTTTEQHRDSDVEADGRVSDDVVAAYRLPELIGLGAAGIVLAILGALIPAGWASRTSVAAALRAE